MIMGLRPIPRQGTCPLHPAANADMQSGVNPAAQVLAPQYQPGFRRKYLRRKRSPIIAFAAIVR